MYNEVRKIDLLSGDTLKTFAQGALGAMTFGAYHQYTTNKMMELNNENQDLLAVGKLSQPLPSSPTTDMNILINLDR